MPGSRTALLFPHGKPKLCLTTWSKKLWICGPSQNDFFADTMHGNCFFSTKRRAWHISEQYTSRQIRNPFLGKWSYFRRRWNGALILLRIESTDSRNWAWSIFNQSRRHHHAEESRACGLIWETEGGTPIEQVIGKCSDSWLSNIYLTVTVFRFEGKAMRSKLEVPKGIWIYVKLGISSYARIKNHQINP